jgi:hypothetical protein
MYSLFHVEGGLGKNVAATAVARCIKSNHPDRELIVVCSYPEVFLHLPYVHKVFQIGNTPYFYRDYIEGKNTLIFKHEPYFTADHIYKKKTLVENWCSLYGLEYKGETPELNITRRIIDMQRIKYKRNKPVLIMHTNGGLFQGQTLNYSWTRDMPKSLGQAVVNNLHGKYHIMQVCRTQENILDGVEPIVEPMSNLELFALLLLSEKRLLIDSCLQHAAAALGLKSTVLWIGSPEKVFGYKMHHNISAKQPLHEPKLPHSYLFDYTFDGNVHEYPYGSDENLFDVDEVLQSLSANSDEK